MLQRLVLPLPEVLPELSTPVLGVPELLDPELPRPELLPVVPLEVLPGVLRAASARSAATQSSNAVPIMPTQRERSEDDAEGLVSEVPEVDEELGLDGLVAPGEVVLSVEPEEVAPPVEPDEVALPVEPAPALPACAKMTPLASALAAKTASAFRGKRFIGSP